MGLPSSVSRISLALVLLPSAALARVQGTTVDAGPDRYVLPPATRIELRGSVSGLRATRVAGDASVAWTLLSGPPAILLGADTLTPTIVTRHPGSLRLRLEVSDPSAGVVADEVAVHVFGTDQDGELSGQARKWHKLSLTFTHDVPLSEGGSPNPFLDLRLVTHFYHADSGAVRSVPGFFAADGNAAETSATTGTHWRVNFTPDRAGTWYYLASFRAGGQVALDPDPHAGQPASFDGANGVVYVECADPRAPGFLSKGRLEYVGSHHLRFAETRESFLKNGAGSPENFLAYHEFDGTFDQGGAPNDLNVSGAQDGLHHYDAHLGDYVDLGVPLWKNGKGRRIFGALSYLASRGVSSLYALSYNLDGGDGQEVWPWFAATAKLRYDVSKLAQWERVVDHMTRAGIVWHVLTQEAENDHVLDGGALGVQRKLYYRELVARFAHAPGLVWNLGEENDNTPGERRAFAEYLRALDPYDHPVALHNRVGDVPGTFGPLLGTHLELVSLQGDPLTIPASARDLVDDSARAGRPWVVNFDEQNPANEGVVPDSLDFWHDSIRREALWPMLLGQGGGCEWYFGYAHPHSDLDCEDFRSRDNLWRLSTRALDFVRGHVPFAEMEHADPLATGAGASTLAKRGELYLVYLPFGGPATLDLEGHVGPFRVSWFDARDGGALRDGAVTQVSGPGPRSLGSPPGPDDWVAFVRLAANAAPAIDSVAIEPRVFVGGQDVAVLVHARDPNGPSDPLGASVEVRDSHGTLVATLPLRHRGGSLHSLFLPDVPDLGRGTWQLRVTVQDAAGASATRTVSYQTY